jgi:hypothetical protein
MVSCDLWQARIATGLGAALDVDMMHHRRGMAA